MTNSVHIAALDYYLPEKVEHNEDLRKDFPGRISPTLIEKIGIKSRHIVENNTTASHLALKAGEKLLAETNFDKSTLNALVYCSIHHDYMTPSTSCLLQDQLGLNTNIASFDITHGCSGYLYGLSLAKSLLLSSPAIENILFLTGSVLTKYVHPENLASRLLFGDAGSATILTRSTTDGGSIGEFVYKTDGSGYEKIIVRDGMDGHPISSTSLIEKKDEYGNVYTDASFYMDSPAIFTFILKEVPIIIEQTLAVNKLGLDDIDLFVLHQPNQFPLEGVRKNLKISEDRFFYSLEKTGNTVQATIPIALKSAQQLGKIKKGSKVMIAGFGTGLSLCATIVTF